MHSIDCVTVTSSAMFKLLLVLFAVSSTSALHPTDILTCNFTSWCYLLANPQHWQLSVQNSTMSYAMLTTTKGGAISAMSFTNWHPICFRFKYQLQALRLPVNLTIVSTVHGQLFYNESTDPHPSTQWIDGEITIPATANHIVSVVGRKSVDEENVFVAQFKATHGACP